MKPTRRSFFTKASAALALPLATGAFSQAPVAAADDVTSVRRLQQALAREINGATGHAAELFAGGTLPLALAGVIGLQPMDFGEHDFIEIAADGRTARATFRCAVESHIPIAAEGTLIDMARAQGEGFTRSKAYRILDMVYVRARGTWKIDVLSMHEV